MGETNAAKQGVNVMWWGSEIDINNNFLGNHTDIWYWWLMIWNFVFLYYTENLACFWMKKNQNLIWTYVMNDRPQESK